MIDDAGNSPGQGASTPEDDGDLNSPTTCARGGFRSAVNFACFQVLALQAVAAAVAESGMARNLEAPDSYIIIYI
jgi:hypothetical protein